MGPVRCFRILCLTLTFSAQLAGSFPQTTVPPVHLSVNSQRCKWCPAGEYQKSCTECAACPEGSYTTELNQEDRCSRCSRDCRPKFHLKVIQNCTNVSNVKCVCEEGYTCTEEVPYSDNCRKCRKLQETTPAGKGEYTPPAFSTGHQTAAVDPCNFSTSVQGFPASRCGSKPSPVTHTDSHVGGGGVSSLLATTLACLFGGACMALLLLVYMRGHRNKTCFKKAMALLMCNKGGRKASHKSKESTHHFPRDSFSAKQQLPPVSSANLGPVHVHNPGTIIFSLLSQFTGQVGPTTEGEVKAKMETGDDRGCPVFQPAPSPSIPISEEERSRETDSIFFPFQEQGKDYHVSKEEVL